MLISYILSSAFFSIRPDCHKGSPPGVGDDDYGKRSDGRCALRVSRALSGFVGAVWLASLARPAVPLAKHNGGAVSSLAGSAVPRRQDIKIRVETRLDSLTTFRSPVFNPIQRTGTKGCGRHSRPFFSLSGLSGAEQIPASRLA